MASVVFRLCDKAPDILREVCLERGWEEYDESRSESNGEWNLWWKTQGFTSGEFEHCRPWQRLNHFPKSTNITKKDGLARNLRRMRASYGGSMFEFFPQTFILPNEYRKFVAEFSKQDGSQTSNYWICKPTEQSCGRGIFIFQDLHDLTYDCAVVVQKYIIKPFLISGYKFDLRLYAIVTSYHPFLLYIYHEGLVRFSTERFDLSSLDNRFSHLTNTSINKTGPQYSAEKESIGTGCKWTLSKLRHFFHKHNIDDRLLWHRITSIIIITLLSQMQDIPSNSSNCFELFGFDVLIDEKLKPWLLEVNFSPALGNDCSQDEIVKKPLLNDILESLNFTEVDIKRGETERGSNSTRQKGLKLSSVKSGTARNGKSLSSKSKIGYDLSSLDAECRFKQHADFVKKPVSDAKKQYAHMGLQNQRPSYLRRQKSDVTLSVLSKNDKAANCNHNGKLPSSKSSVCCNRRFSTSEYFVKAGKINCNGPDQDEMNKNTVASCDDIGFQSNPDCATFAEENLSLSTDPTKEVEKGCTEGEQISSLSTVRGQTESQTSLHLSQFANSSNQLPPHLRFRRSYSEASSLNSLQLVDNQSLSNRSQKTLHHISSRYSRHPTGRTPRNKATSVIVKLQPKIGNCILAFPFNEVTHKASKGKLEQKIVVTEIRKMLKEISNDIKSTPLQTNEESLDLQKPFWGYRLKFNTFYSSLLPDVQ